MSTAQPTEESTATLAVAPSSGSASATAPSLSVEAALRREEMGRIQVFARLTLVLCVGGFALIPVYGGDPLARRWVTAALLIAMATSSCIEWMMRKPQRYRRGWLVAIVQVQELCATVAAYYFGAFSPFPAVVSLGIYVYSLGASRGNALACYLNLAVGQATLGALIITGTISDRGIIHAHYLAPFDQLIAQTNIQLVYLLAFVLARLSRRKTLSAVAEHVETVRAVAQREALFEEARQELEKAAWLGRAGRFTDQRLGAYTLGPVIGRGAMGEIYRAQHVDTGAPAAVKLLQREGLSNRGHLMRFAREAKIAASLDTPYVVRILAVGETPLPYIAMELLEGEDLARRLRERATLSLAETAVLVRHASLGLAAAHARGIVHRDVKPQNLFWVVGDTPCWKLLDFGISKQTSDEGTLTGAAVVGTPAYMAPEQAAGRDVDARADIYALAAVAYRSVTGHLLFAAREPAAMIHAVIHQMPARPGSLATVPADVDAVFAIGLAKRPADRFPDAETLANAFEAAIENRLDPSHRENARAILAQSPWKRTRAATEVLPVMT